MDETYELLMHKYNLSMFNRVIVVFLQSYVSCSCTYATVPFKFINTCLFPSLMYSKSECGIVLQRTSVLINKQERMLSP